MSTQAKASRRTAGSACRPPTAGRDGAMPRSVIDRSTPRVRSRARAAPGWRPAPQARVEHRPSPLRRALGDEVHVALAPRPRRGGRRAPGIPRRTIPCTRPLCPRLCPRFFQTGRLSVIGPAAGAGGRRSGTIHGSMDSPRDPTSQPAILRRLRERAARLKASIALPESTDPRVLEAAARAVAERLARPVLVGAEDEVRVAAARRGHRIAGRRRHRRSGGGSEAGGGGRRAATRAAGAGTEGSRRPGA